MAGGSAIEGAPPPEPAASAPAPSPDDAARAREHLANERTLLAWTRTSLTLIGLGFVVARFGLFVRELENPGSQPRLRASVVIGISLVAAGLVTGAASVVRFFRARAQIDEGRFRAEYWPELLLTGVVGVLGVALAVYLAVNG